MDVPSVVTSVVLLQMMLPESKLEETRAMVLV